MRRGLFPIGYPDIGIFRGFPQEHVASTLFRVFPAVKFSMVYPVALHRFGNLKFNNIAGEQYKCFPARCAEQRHRGMALLAGAAGL